MREKTYTIYDICGNKESDARLLVHVEDAEIPGDWQYYESAIVNVKGEQIFSEYHVNEWLTSMWQSPAGDVFACSMNGSIYHSKHGKWEIVSLDERYSLNDIWGLCDNEVYTCGLEDVLFQNVNNSWQRVITKTKKDFVKIRGTSCNDLYMIGRSGSLFCYNGVNWLEIDSPTNIRLLSILCVSTDEVYICGENGSIFKGCKDKWLKIGNVDFDFWSLVKYNDKVFVAGGEEGIFSIENDALVPFNTEIEVSGLQVIGKMFYAYDINIVYIFDGKKWTKTEFDFEKLITHN